MSAKAQEGGGGGAWAIATSLPNNYDRTWPSKSCRCRPANPGADATEKACGDVELRAVECHRLCRPNWGCSFPSPKAFDLISMRRKKKKETKHFELNLVGRNNSNFMLTRTIWVCCLSTARCKAVCKLTFCKSSWARPARTSSSATSTWLLRAAKWRAVYPSSFFSSTIHGRGSLDNRTRIALHKRDK